MSGARRSVTEQCLSASLFSSPAYSEDQEQEGERDDRPNSEYHWVLCAEFIIVAFQVDDDYNPR